MNINIPPHPTPSTPPHDQRNIISVTWTWTLTSHPTPPYSIIKKNGKTQNKKKKKTTKHPGALQCPWQLVWWFIIIFQHFFHEMAISEVACLHFRTKPHHHHILSFVARKGCPKGRPAGFCGPSLTHAMPCLYLLQFLLADIWFSIVFLFFPGFFAYTLHRPRAPYNPVS